jgi:hypothetical protein
MLAAQPHPAPRLSRRAGRGSLRVRAAGCPFCNGTGCLSICKSPQNVGDPEEGPQPSLSAPSAVATQLNAMQLYNTPRNGHGLSVAYEFCGGANEGEC